MDRPVVEALLDRGLDQTVLIKPGKALELRRGDDRPQVVATPRLVNQVDGGAGQRRLDHPPDLCQAIHRQKCTRTGVGTPYAGGPPLAEKTAS